MVDLLRAERGAASVEYVVVLVTVALLASLAIVAAGALLFQLLRYQTHLLMLPVP